eukprot:TRINITY_DN23216_c0_g1_i1.p1 TRINITY_DN23216_c0_g1~~TRINITY_DN23216_c0_g1_i1.p1  ORF type:complete len:497 (-),score=112.45 TRINITY_DN23216_c0_g1_i1:161-1651(-)
MGAPPAGSSYGYLVGGVFIFNLIVGTGALTLPSGYAVSGVVLAGLVTALVALLAYIGVTFVLECMSHATVIKRSLLSKEKDINTPLSEDLPGERYASISTVSYNGDGTEGAPGTVAYGMDHVELGAMSEIFLGKVGRYLFYGILLVYLYGDLAIYAVVVPQSLNRTFVNNDDGLDVFGITVSTTITYWFFLACYAAFALPFCFFNFSNTKYLQLFTICYRNLAFWTMIILALIWIFDGDGDESTVELARFKGLPSLWGTVIYCFMCHHSIPGLVSPLVDKTYVHWLMGGVYLVLVCFYSLLSMSAMFAYDPYEDISCEGKEAAYPCGIDSVYTYNFLKYSNKFVSYYLTLFPVFTITTNYPLIAITLRNNMLHIFSWGEGSSWEHNRSHVYSALAAIPSFLLACVFVDVDVLVSLTGAYAGLGIEFVIPAVLIYYSRMKMREQFPGEKPANNPYASPFQSVFFIYLMLGVAALTLVIVTLNNGVDFYNWIDSEINS